MDNIHDSDYDIYILAGLITDNVEERLFLENKAEVIYENNIQFRSLFKGKKDNRDRILSFLNHWLEAYRGKKNIKFEKIIKAVKLIESISGKNVILKENENLLSYFKLREILAGTGKTKASDLMNYLKVKYAGQFDIKTAKEVIKELVTEFKTNKIYR